MRRHVPLPRQCGRKCPVPCPGLLLGLWVRGRSRKDGIEEHEMQSAGSGLQGTPGDKRSHSFNQRQRQEYHPAEGDTY